MASDVVVSASGLSKAYAIYHRPQDRLKQMLWRNRRKFYDDFWALRGVDLEVRRGETVGIIGRNGSGKSTLLQLICGTLTPTSGTIAVRGRVAALLELGTGFNPEFTGRENVFLNASVLGLSDAETRDRFGAIEAFADIGEFIDQPVKHYSSGMYARLAFAVAVHVEPDVLIVDEILAVGDAAFQRKCMERFYAIRDRGCTILFVSHDAYQVKVLCQRALYLANGCPVQYGPVGDVVDRYVEDLERSMQQARSTAVEEPKEPESLFKIVEVRFENDRCESIDELSSGDDVRLRMRYVSVVGDPRCKIGFVANLYREHDELYVWGTTTLMERLEPFDARTEDEVVISFPRFPLLNGRYVWRVAICDQMGVLVHAQARLACPFRVVDDYRAAGLVDVPHAWWVASRPGEREAPSAPAEGDPRRRSAR